MALVSYWCSFRVLCSLSLFNVHRATAQLALCFSKCHVGRDVHSAALDGFPNRVQEVSLRRSAFFWSRAN